MICVYGLGIYCWTDSLHYDYDTAFCGYTYSRITIYGSGAYCRTNGLKTFVRVTSNCSDTEYLMYDYSMSIGDTAHVGYNLYSSPDTANITLQNIDTVIYFGVARRRFHMLFNHNQPHSTFLNIPMTWIEGIGSDWNPFYPVYCLHDGCESTYSLRCYDSSGVQLYMNPAISICDSATGINEYDAAKEINISPNPATSEFRIMNAEFRIESVEVFDVFGKKILSSQLQTSNFKLQTVSIDPVGIISYGVDVSGLSNGMYFVRVFTENGIVTKKFIKQ